MTDSARAACETAPLHLRPDRPQALPGNPQTERTRLLYRGSRIPNLLLLATSLACVALLWTQADGTRLLTWAACMAALALLGLQQSVAFERAGAERQRERAWHLRFLAGSAVSALGLAYAIVALVPADAFLQQATLYGLIGSVVLYSSVAYGVSLPAFLSFAVPCLLPSGLVLLAGDTPQQRGWGVLAMIVLATLSLTAWQISRLIGKGLQQRQHKLALIERLGSAAQRAEQLNAELAREVEQRRNAERQLRQAYDDLEQRVEARTRELARVADELRQSEARLNLALEASELGLWDWDLEQGQVLHSRLEVRFGRTDNRDEPLPDVHPDDLPQVRATLVAHLKGETEQYVVDYRAITHDGQCLWIEDRGRVIQRGDNGRALRMIGTRRDISILRRQAEQQRLAATVFDSAAEGVVVMDPGYRILTVNDACCELSGFTRDELLGRSVALLASSVESQRQYSLMREALERDGHWQGELTEARKNGETYPLWVQLRRVNGAGGEASHVVGFLSDLTVRRQAEERLRYLTLYDDLTGLANRRLLKERLHEACQRARQTGRHLAVLFIDLDRFNILNDSLGHEAADALLREMSRRLAANFSNADTIARLSGDEFVVLIENYGSLASLAHLGSRLLARIRKPTQLGGQELVVSASVGISLLPENAREPASLLRQANLAMQQAKHLGGNTLQFFTERQPDSSLDQLRLENQLRKALVDEQLEVFYQPRLNLGSDRIEAAEALVRWRHPEQGLVPPGQFIALAEETGLIIPLGEFVLREACRQASRWRQDGVADIRVSVNLSGKQLRQGNFISLVRQVLEETGLPAERLELELTESQLLDDVDGTIGICRQLRALGVKMAIDDFGTGYSSLSYLKRFPVDYVKIDRSFVSELEHSAEDAAIVRAIIAMVHSLELKVVAEGVETAAQLAFIRAQRCDELQGYLLSRPLPAAAFVDLLD
ncbi:EAL domain-containing protein [Pseudomonas oligotrophica]|uniref:EAL domain-containing protein n=1 Tax=Pseudomonas oligotrophica TaxID=2912055 RepID=UPI001F33A009|nr:EAL domain-containing protein [Pseudomonas oligotrophica]MCF7200551.1 EAL domain-containing protein [Pseudomonas oligotrophica]